MVEIIANEGKYIELGRVGENAHTRIKFPIADYLSEYPGAEFTLLNLRPGDETAYPVLETETDTEYLYWTVAASALNEKGRSWCELVVRKNSVTVKSVIYGTRIRPALDDGGTAPEPWESWQQEMTRLLAETQRAAEEAAGDADDAAEAEVGALTAAREAAASASDAADSARDAAASAEAAANFRFYIDNNGDLHVAYGEE